MCIFAERRWQLPLEDPAAFFWRRAVSGMQDDLMPIPNVISSVPISLLSLRAVGLDYSAVHSVHKHINTMDCSMSWCGSGTSQPESHKMVNLILFHLLYKRGSLATSPLVLNTYIAYMHFSFFTNREKPTHIWFFFFFGLTIAYDESVSSVVCYLAYRELLI